MTSHNRATARCRTLVVGHSVSSACGPRARRQDQTKRRCGLSRGPVQAGQLTARVTTEGNSRGSWGSVGFHFPT